jgi:hypothetical protein
MSQITIKDFLKGNPINDLTIIEQHRMEALLEAVNNALRLANIDGLVCTSGFRSMSDHLRIYSKKIQENKDYNLTHLSSPRHEHFGIPMRSRHLSCEAIDIGGAKIKELQQWCLDNQEILAGLNLYCEDFSVTTNWVHFQNVSPASGRRFFSP